MYQVLLPYSNHLSTWEQRNCLGVGATAAKAIKFSLEAHAKAGLKIYLPSTLQETCLGYKQINTNAK